MEGLQAYEGLDPEIVRLLVKGQAPPPDFLEEDGKTLAEYGLRPNSTVYMLLRLRNPTEATTYFTAS